MREGTIRPTRCVLRALLCLVLALFPLASVARAQTTTTLPLPMASFNQAFRDLPGSWGAFAMGTGGCQDRIAGAGCLITCFAMVLDYYQVELDVPASSSSTGKARRGMDPGILNDWLKTHAGYGRCAEDRSGSCCLEWANLPSAVSVTFYENKGTAGLDAASRQTIDRALAAGHPVVAGVHWGRYCHGTTVKSEDCHWVVLTRKVGTTYSIVDPYNQDSGEREGVVTTLADGVFGSYVVDRFVVVTGSVPTSPRPRVDLEITFDPGQSLHQGDVQRRLIRTTGIDKALLLYARVIDPQGKISYAYYPTQDPSPGEALLLSSTEKSVFPQARRFTDTDWEWNQATLTEAGTGTWVWEMWVEDPDRRGDPLAYDLAAYVVAQGQAPVLWGPDAVGVILAIGFAVLLTAALYLLALSAR